jgi:hypothetical protein
VAADVQARLERQEEGAEKEQQELVKLMVRHAGQPSARHSIDPYNYV